MEEKYFMHRIQEENGVYSKGIEIHDTKEEAILSFWGRMKLAYGGNPTVTFMHCKITDINGNRVEDYDLPWNAETEHENKFFLHHIRYDGDTPSKDIDVFDTFDAARAAFGAAMEYGYNNTKHPNVKYVSCEITDRSGSVMDPFKKTWNPTEEEPAEQQAE